ncbi:MAG: glycosyltransferase [Nanoarchaeota archaeon]
MDFYNVLVYILAYIGFVASSFYVINLFAYYKRRQSERESIEKKVTILIPAYNEEKSIEKTIKSALSLNYPKDKLEVIIIDDGSKDKTYELAKRFASNQNLVVKVLTKKNGGKGTALNLGIKNASGEIIVSMDADSFVSPDALKKMVYYFKNEKVMAVTPSMGVYKPSGFLQRIQQIEYYMGVFLRKSFATMNAIHITPGAFSAYRKSFFEKYGGYDEKNITEDLEIALRIQSKNFIIENSPKSVVYTIAPKSFRSLLVQRRRWYTGLVKNLWSYKKLFGFKKGPLGYLVLPVAVSTILLSVILTSYVVIKTSIDIKDEIISLQAINFRFQDSIDINKYIIETFFYRIFSSPTFLISIIFIFLLIFYMFFSRKQMQYTDNLKINFIMFIFFYSILFTIWWIFSFLYILFNKKVVWRKE